MTTGSLRRKVRTTVPEPSHQAVPDWITRGKAALNAFEITFEGRLAAATKPRKAELHR